NLGRPVHPQQRLGREVVGHGGERGIEVRQQELDAGEVQAVLELLQQLAALEPRHLEIAAALVDGAYDALLGAAAEGDLADGEDEQLLLRAEGALGDGVEAVDALDHVADQLQAQRMRVSRRIDVDDAAAYAELAAV